MAKLVEYKEFVQRLRAFCIANGYEISGTCGSEGIYGEITVLKIGDEPGWSAWEENKFNFTDKSGEPIE